MKGDFTRNTLRPKKGKANRASAEKEVLSRRRKGTMALMEHAKEDVFLMGVRCGSEIATMLVKDGWKKLDKLTAEVLSRVTGRSVSFPPRVGPDE